MGTYNVVLDTKQCADEEAGILKTHAVPCAVSSSIKGAVKD